MQESLARKGPSSYGLKTGNNQMVRCKIFLAKQSPSSSGIKSGNRQTPVCKKCLAGKLVVGSETDHKQIDTCKRSLARSMAMRPALHPMPPRLRLFTLPRIL